MLGISFGGLASSSSGFSPASLPLEFWWDFSDAATRFQDASRTTPATANTDPIGGVTDKSGMGRHLSQSSSGSRPALDTSGINSASSCKFASGAKWLEAGTFSPTLAQPTTVYIVIRNANTSDGFAFDGAATGGRNAICLFGGQWSGYAGNFGGELALADVGVYIIGIEFHGASSKIFRNGVQTSGSNGPLVYGMGSQAMGGVTVGSDSGDVNFPFAGWIGEIIGVNRALTSDERAALEGYLSSKWSRPVYTHSVSGTIGSDNWYLMVPPSYTTGAPKLVMYHHGHAAAGSAIFTDSLTWTSIQALQTAGYWICSTDLSGDHWGRPASVTAASDLLTLLTGRESFSKVLFWGISMGGLSSLNSLADSRFSGLIAGWHGTYPACNLSTIFDANSGTFAPNIRTAYGIASDGSDYASKTAGSDPLTLAASAFPAILYRFVASPDDTVIPKADNTDPMRTLLLGRSPAPPEVSLRAHTGDHGDASAFDTSDMVSFFDRC
jgi:hypothetical protein